MTRLELLQLVIGRARSNGFELRRWYTTRLELPWISQEAAIALLATQRRYYALVFSHEFAQTFWKPGAEISFDVPPQSFRRAMPDGSVKTIQRKPYIRRSARPNAWRFHLRQMALVEEPLRYLRKYLHIEEDLMLGDQATPELIGEATAAAAAKAAASTAASPASKRSPRPLPKEPPAFLQRPYRPTPK